jgi:hypothetical protein
MFVSFTVTTGIAIITNIITLIFLTTCILFISKYIINKYFIV